VVPNLTTTFSNALLYIITILLGVSVGAKAQAVYFLTPKTLGILLLGMIAFSFGTFGGVLLGKLMYKLSNGEVNPLIGSAGVSAVPMARACLIKSDRRKIPPISCSCMQWARMLPALSVLPSPQAY
jgi:oxaloacetate decarboxylase beta subunit